MKYLCVFFETNLKDKYYIRAFVDDTNICQILFPVIKR